MADLQCSDSESVTSSSIVGHAKRPADPILPPGCFLSYEQCHTTSGHASSTKSGLTRRFVGPSNGGYSGVWETADYRQSTFVAEPDLISGTYIDMIHGDQCDFKIPTDGPPTLSWTEIPMSTLELQRRQFKARRQSKKPRSHDESWDKPSASDGSGPSLLGRMFPLVGGFGQPELHSMFG